MPTPRLLPRPLTISRAADTGPVMRLLAASRRWLLDVKRTDQWSGVDHWADKMSPAFERGDVWLLKVGPQPIGTVTLERVGDPDFWTPAELAESAAYLSKVTVRRAPAFRGLGELLIAWAVDRAYRTGCDLVRLDAWKTNTELHRYYRERGWTYLRTDRDHPNRNSGALFQTRARPMTADQWRRIQEAPALPLLHTSSYAPDFPDPAGNRQPGHVHRGGLAVAYYWTDRTMPADFDPDYRYVVRETAPGIWVLEGGPAGAAYRDPHGIVERAGFDLVPGREYVITHQPSDPCGMVLTEQTAERSASAIAA